MSKLLITLMVCLATSACTKIDYDAEYAATLKKYECTRTGEFVGKDADPVYECKGYGKYTSSELHYQSYKDHMK